MRLYAFSCILRDVKEPLDGYNYFDVGGVCIEPESDLFLIDMAAEGRGNTILTRAPQFLVLRNCSGIQDLLLSPLSF